MNKKIYLIIISLITVFCILSGTVYHLSGYLFSDMIGITILQEENSSSDSANTQNRTNDARTNYDANVDAFDHIRIDASVLSITIEDGDTYHVAYDCDSRLTPDIQVSDGTLIIKQKDSRLLNSQNLHCTLTVTVPDYKTLGTLDVQADVGDISISEVSAETVSLQADVGSIHADNCSFSHINAEADVGSIQFEHCNLDGGEISADIGEIRLTDCDFTNMELSGELGDIIVTTASDLKDFQIELSVELGSILVNSETYKKSYTQRGASGKRLEIENEMGSIALKYGE